MREKSNMHWIRVCDKVSVTDQGDQGVASVFDIITKERRIDEHEG